MIKTGLDRLIGEKLNLLKGKRVGLLCHQASVNRHVQHVLELFREHKLPLAALFGPEHGLWGTAQDQIPVHAERNSELNIPIFSLYGDQRAPTPESIQGIDVMVCDLQDVGSRYYTFIWTMALAMQVCAKYQRRFLVLDRPNPIGGQTLEGPVLDPVFASFVGLYPIPVRHGLTIGEMALWLNKTLGLGVDLEVLPMQGWKRRMDFAATGLPWVLPSPNMPTPDTALVYPGGCLIEGTNLSEGRGTTRPFELIGAPYINPEPLAALLNSDRLPGILFRPCRFEPTFHKFAKELCGAVQLHVTDPRRFKPFFTVLTLIKRVYDLYPRSFAWRPPPYEYETEKLPFDILCGTDTIRKTIEAGGSLKQLERLWAADLRGFELSRRDILLYN